MHNYFDPQYNLQRIKDLNLTVDVQWVIDLNTRYHQDGLHIIKKFILPNPDVPMVLIKTGIYNFYKAKHLFKGKYRDIKSFKNYEEFINFQNYIWPKINKNIKLIKKIIKPLEENTDPNFLVFRIDNFYESKALTHGHEAFDGNHYNYCFGINEYDYNLYTNFREREGFLSFKHIKDNIIRCNTLYFIRDLRKTTEYSGKIPNCIYKEPKHIITIFSGIQPSLTYSYHVESIEYGSMNCLFKSNPDLITLKNILTFKYDGGSGRI